MQLTGLLDLLRQDAAYHELVSNLKTNNKLSVNLIRSARPFLVAALAQDWPGPVIYLTSSIKRAYNVTEQLPVWCDAGVYRFAEPTPQFYERISWSETTIQGRLEALGALMPVDDGMVTQAVIITSARALMQRTLPPNQFRRASMLLRQTERRSIDKLLAQWVSLGYESGPLVVEPGTFSRRGGVLDIYPIAATQPVRIDFFDDEIESLRLFDPTTQRSSTRLNHITITPAREVLPELTPQVGQYLESWFTTLPLTENDMTTPAGDLESLKMGNAFAYLEHYLPYVYPNPVSLLDYAPDNALIVVEDWDELQDTITNLSEQAQQNRDEQINAQQLAPDHPQPYLDWAALQETLAEHNILQLGLSESNINLSQTFIPSRRFGGQLRSMLTDLRETRNAGGRVVVVTQQAGRLTQLWYEQDTSAFVPTMNDVLQTPGNGRVLFVNGTLQEGWNLVSENGTTRLLTDAEIFGWSRPEPRRRKSARRSRSPEADYADWNDGDYVVHADYGVGQFGGMIQRTIESTERQYLVVHYGGNDTLYVPIHQADRLTKYIGADDSPPSVNRLGHQDWIRTKTRAKKAVEEEAHELLKLYAARTQAAGYAYAPDNHWQHELEASFSYVETEDQLRAVSEVKADMKASHPMDRLICGDVGYGKTEVALRAAFKAVMDGKQVAVLVPTTVLAQQHYDTFTNRLANFPINVEMMSRFRTKDQQNRMLPKVAAGEIDILLGTHRILSKDVTFKDLGLVIIDEEQRFGVKQKEHFKALRTQIDILTLTATPIPRTLYMSMTGVRDISMIQTPPEERLPIITHVGKFDNHLVRQAILREIERGGQTFIVHNRIRTIDSLREKLEDIVPEARIVTGHGQMHERTLEKVMASFAQGEFDVLLSTAIIENGIDIPNANTLIVDRADWFGMSQLYQLRGRVGRSAQQAYSYFFHPRKMTEEARARLETLAENTGLGSGFQIAMRDLEIRGAGDILSTRQTGHVAAIGLHLYTQLLTQAIQRLRGSDADQSKSEVALSDNERSIVINLPLPAYVPSDWIEEIALRLQIYRRIAGLQTEDEIHAMREELKDRFGLLPNAVEGLLYQIEIKLMAQAANATHVITRKDEMQIKLPYLAQINRPALEQALGDDVTVSRTAIAFKMADDTWQIRLLDILGYLAEGVRQAVESGSGL